MKVICIDAKKRALEVPILVEGKVYTPTGKDCPMGCCYELAEDLCFYHKDRFVPLSDIDETELVKERENIYA